MTVWHHLSTIFNSRNALRITGIVLLCVALVTTLLFANVARAQQSTNKTINFQGRLLTASGAVVADGYYNIQFKIYQGGAGNAVNNPGGSLKWTESYTNNGGNNGVLVKNGFFSVGLGSATPFGTSVDWDQDTLWLSMNIAGSAAGCATFGSGPCTADGEMLPMKRITATPYAINAGAVGGKTAANLVQLAQGVQTDASLNTSSIHINKTGTGNLLQFQNSGSDVFSVTNNGNIEFGNSDNHAIYVGGAAPDTTGKNLTIFAGYGGGGAGSMGGGLFLQGGSAGGDNAEGGSVTITGGVGTGTGKNGSVYIGTGETDAVQIGSTNLTSGTQTINIGNNNTAGGTTNITIGSGGDAAGGTTNIQAKNTVSISTNGQTRATFSDTTSAVYFGNGVSASAPDDFTLQGTNSSASSVNGGSLTVQGGNATTGNANGGNVTLSGGTGSGTGANGLVVINTPAFSTVTNDTNCYTGGSLVAASCTVTSNSVNNSAVVVVGFSAAGQTVTIPDPAIATPGRTFYVMAASNSQDFTLAINGGGGGNIVSMRKNITTPLMWNGTDWTVVGGSGATTLQDAYNNTPQNAGGVELTVNNTTPTNSGLTIRESSSAPANDTLLAVQSASNSTLLSVNSNINELASNPGAEAAGSSASTFPAGTWSPALGAEVGRHTTAGNNIESGRASVKASASGGNGGAYNQLVTALTPGQSYTLSASIRMDSGTANNIAVLYSPDGTAIQNCLTDIAVTANEWKRVTCQFQAPASGITASNGIAIVPLSASGEMTYYIDNLSVIPTSSVNLATDGTVDDDTNFSTNWTSTGTGSTVTRDAANSSVQAVITTGGAHRGIRNKLTDDLQANKRYRISVNVQQAAGSTFTDFAVRYSGNNGTNFNDCVDYNTRTITSNWTSITCYITTGSTAPSGAASHIYLVAGSSAARTFSVDSLRVAPAPSTTANVQVGSQANKDDATLFTLDRAAKAPSSANQDALLGSMYYDTTLGKVQCYEASGWGSCGSSPDNFVTISPEYTNAVMHGSGTGTLSTDFCSDSLNINDGSASQPTICGTNETYNLYKWTTQDNTDQTRSIFVTYQLPTTFKKFVSGSTSLMGRTDSTNANVTYQVYRNNSNGLTACGDSVPVSTGSQSTWQKATAGGAADPSNCKFEAGDSIVIRINLTAKSDAKAYVSNLGFTFSNN